jgi:hypothetical protein
MIPVNNCFYLIKNPEENQQYKIVHSSLQDLMDHPFFIMLFKNSFWEKD